jgi:hypothetical protein
VKKYICLKKCWKKPNHGTLASFIIRYLKKCWKKPNHGTLASFIIRYRYRLAKMHVRCYGLYLVWCHLIHIDVDIFVSSWSVLLPLRCYPPPPLLWRSGACHIYLLQRFRIKITWGETSGRTYELKHIRSSWSSNLAMWRRELAVAFTSGNADALHASMFTVCIL